MVADGIGYVRRLKDEPGGHVLVWGSLDLMRLLLRARLLTNLELFVAPMGLGGGNPLLAPKGPYTLLFRNGDCYSSGAVRLLYTIVYP